MMLVTFLVLTLLLLALTLLPLLHVEAWWIRVLDFPRLQLATLALLILIAEVVLLDFSHPWSWMLAALSLGCLLYHTWRILPYTALWRVEVRDAAVEDPDRTLSIMTANVLQPNRNAQGLLEMVRQLRPDVLVTLESDQWWQTRLDALEPDYPHTIKCPLDNLYGMHVYSRLPLEDGCIDYLLDDEIPSMHTCIVLPGGDRIGAHFLHPKPPSPTESLESSKRDAELVIVGRQVKHYQAPMIVAGDLNDVAWSRTTRLFRKISGLRDPRVGRGMFNTYHARYRLLRWPLDHLFHSDHFTLREIRRLKGFGSDHFPLFTRLIYEGPRDNPSTTPEPDADDRELAREKMRDEGVDRHDVPRRAPDNA